MIWTGAIQKMIVRGIINGDRIPIDLYFGTEKKCKSWISERDLNIFTYLAICEDNVKPKQRIR